MKEIQAWKIWVMILVLSIALGTVVASILNRVPEPAPAEPLPSENAVADEEMLQVVIEAFAQAHFEAVSSVNDDAFSAYVFNELQEACPFYVPSGNEYRGCLSKLIETQTKNAQLSAESIRAMENYCTEISAPIGGNEQMNLYLSCMAFKSSAQ